MQSKLLEGHERGIRILAWSPDSKLLASASNDNTIRLWDRKGQSIKLLEGHKSAVFILSWSPDNKLLVSVEPGRAGVKKIPAVLGLWDKDGISIKWQRISPIRAVAWSPNGELLASGSYDKRVRIWGRTGKLIRTLKGHTGSVSSLAWSSTTRLLASSSNTSEIILWDQEWNKTKFFHDEEQRSITKLSWSPDGKILASYNGGKIHLWNSEGEHIRSLIDVNGTSLAHTADILDLKWASDGNLLVSASWDCTIRFWDMQGKCFRLIKIPDSRSEKGLLLEPRSISFTPSGDILASTFNDGTLRLWNRDAECIGTIKLDSFKTSSLAVSIRPFYKSSDTINFDDRALWSPDGKTLAVWDIDYTSILFFEWITASPDHPVSETKGTAQLDEEELVEEKICPICHDPILPKHEIYKCHYCTTAFHAPCIRRWIHEEGYKLCPQCGNLFFIFKE